MPANLQSPMMRLWLSGPRRFLSFHNHFSLHGSSSATSFTGCWSIHAINLSLNSAERTTVFARLAFLLPSGDIAMPPHPFVPNHSSLPHVHSDSFRFWFKKNT